MEEEAAGARTASTNYSYAVSSPPHDAWERAEEIRTQATGCLQGLGFAALGDAHSLTDWLWLLLYCTDEAVTPETMQLPS